VTFDELIAEAGRDSRVCLQPQAWNRLWEMLPDRRQVGAGWEPPLPLILAAWWHTSNDEKRERFRDHLRWAHDHSAFDKIEQFISSLKPDDWHTES
jgi:hypothetical protein